MANFPPVTVRRVHSVLWPRPFGFVSKNAVFGLYADLFGPIFGKVKSQQCHSKCGFARVTEVQGGDKNEPLNSSSCMVN